MTTPALRAAALVVEQAEVRCPQGDQLTALEALALGLQDYREDKRYAKAALLEMSRAAVVAWLREQADVHRFQGDIFAAAWLNKRAAEIELSGITNE